MTLSTPIPFQKRTSLKLPLVSAAVEAWIQKNRNN